MVIFHAICYIIYIYIYIYYIKVIYKSCFIFFGAFLGMADSRNVLIHLKHHFSANWGPTERYGPIDFGDLDDVLVKDEE